MASGSPESKQPGGKKQHCPDQGKQRPNRDADEPKGQRDQPDYGKPKAVLQDEPDIG